MQQTRGFFLVTLQYSKETLSKSNKGLKIINILGSKWDQRMQSAIRQIFQTSGKVWAKSVETCAGALGIHANFRCADAEIINDDDAEKINLFRCIQKKPFEFKAKSLLFERTKEAFEKTKSQPNSLSNDINVDEVVRFFILNFFPPATLDILSPLNR